MVRCGRRANLFLVVPVLALKAPLLSECYELALQELCLVGTLSLHTMNKANSSQRALP